MANAYLVVVVDIDDDIGTKAKVKAPVVGRKANLEAAAKLALADPEDPDSNTIYKAISIYDKLKKQGKEVEIVTLAGHNRLGIKASTRIAKQLDTVLSQFPANAAILVTDGSSDEEIIPIIQSRIKIDGIERVVIKQAKELEKTYFVLLEKLKDPHYSRILLGIPALLILLLSIAYAFDIRWQYIGILIGTALLIKGFSLDEWLMDIFESFKIESSKTLATVFYVLASILIFISFYSSYQAYVNGKSLGLAGLELYAYILDAFITPAFFVVLLALVVKLIDYHSLGKGRIIMINHVHITTTTILAFIILKATTMWMTNLYPPYISFSMLLEIVIGALIVEYIASRYFTSLKTNILATLDLKGKPVYDVEGNYYGKITSVNLRRNEIFINSPFGRYKMKLRKIVDVSDSVLIE